MARPPVVKSLPLAVVANGRAVAGMVREGTAVLRRTAELLKQVNATPGSEEAAHLAEYLSDPQLNPSVEKKVEAAAEPRVQTEREKAFARLVRQLQDADEDQLAMVSSVLKATRKAPVAKAAPVALSK